MSSANFFQVIIFFVTSLAFGACLLLLSLGLQKLFKIGKKTPVKLHEYECGMKAIGETQIKLSVKYYLFALMFIVFDVEFMFLLPWAIYFSKTNQNLGLLLVEAFMFVVILGAAWFYALKRKALNWDK